MKKDAKPDERDLAQWRRSATRDRKLWEARAEKLGPDIQAAVDAILTRQALLDRLKAEGYPTVAISGRSVSVDRFMEKAGERACPDADLRSLVYGVLLLKATELPDPPAPLKKRRASGKTHGTDPIRPPD